jgi:hypothetical protein
MFQESNEVDIQFISQSLVKAAYGDERRLLRAPFKVLRAIVPTKVLEDDSATKGFLERQRKNWTVFVGKDDFHSVAWFEGRQ